MLTCLVLTCSLSASAQRSREYIRNAISGWGECRNVAITRTNGDLALYGRNGSARSGVPRMLDDLLVQLHDREEYIDDVQLTESGRWVVLYGDNGLNWYGIPASLESKLREFNRNGEIITSVTFNDSGDWIVITTDHYSSSSVGIQNLLKEGADSYGMLWTACVSEDGLVAVYESGYKFYGNVPSSLRTALSETDMDVYRLKIAGSAWFFADKNGRYRYNM